MSDREDFEKWAESQYYPLRRDSSGDYWVETTQASWDGWHASRATIEVKLPGIYPDCYCPSTAQAYREDCASVLLAAGITVKE